MRVQIVNLDGMAERGEIETPEPRWRRPKILRIAGRYYRLIGNVSEGASLIPEYQEAEVHECEFTLKPKP